MSVPKGYTCKCGKFNQFDAYVYAHANVDLIHRCACRRKYIIRNFRATPKSKLR